MGLNKEEVKNKVIEMLATTACIDKSVIQLDSKFINDLGLDSFDAVNLGFDLETNFQIEIPDADLVNLKTVNDIVEYIFSKQ